MAALSKFFLKDNYNALSTYPDLKHLVHTLILFVEPFTTALTLLMLGDQLLEVFLFEKVTLFPNTFPFAQISHTLDMKTPP